MALELVPETAAARARTHPVGMTRSAPIVAGKAAEGADGLRPQDLHSAYALPTTAPSMQTIALVDAYNDPEAESDLKAYDEEFGLPGCTSSDGCFKQVNQEGKTSPLPKTEGGWSLEISLDIEVAHAVCQDCHILLVEAKTPSYANLEAAEDTAAAAGATEISNSWGGEPPSVDSAAFDHPGIVIAAAAGDDGYLNWDASKKDERGFVDYPASSPHVVAVGGTHLELNSPANTWKSETVWNGYGATGGGCGSEQFDAQPWQQELADWSTVGCGTRRAVADVSADADPYTGVAVYDTTPYEGKVLGWLPVGGTSLATPLIASVYALAGGADGVPYPAETLYENELKSPGSLHDVQTGSNGECTKGYNSEGLSDCTTLEEAASCSDKAICMAGPGYDGPTGVGTPNGTRAFEPAGTDAPVVSTEPASAVTQSSATLNATVNPDGVSVSECKFEYGTSVSYGASVPCASSPGSGASPVAVSASLTGLAANTEYHYRVVATNTGGTSKGADQTLKTLPDAPVVSTEPASAVTQSSATLNATVNPDGVSVSECKFEYGTSVSYGASVPCASSPGSGASPVAVSASLTGLAANTEYHYRVVAANTGGTSKGADQTLKTLPDAPVVSTEPASAVTQSSATLNATVNPDGVSVSECKFEYGTSVSYGASVPCATLPGSGASPVAVSASLTGLAANTEYHYRVVATNTGGTSKGADQTLKTLPDAPVVTDVSPNAGLESGWTAVTITGTELSEATVVQFGFTDALFFEVNSPTSITAISPAGTGVVDVTVTTPGGTSTTSTADQFRYVPAAPAPTIKKLSPKRGSASGGTSVTIKGTSFVGVTAVKFGSTSATSFEVNSPTSITAVSPEGEPGTVEVTVTTPNGTNPPSSKDLFTFKKPAKA